MLTVRRTRRKELAHSLTQAVMILNQVFNSFAFCILSYKTQGLNTCSLFELISTVQVSFIVSKKEKKGTMIRKALSKP